MISLDIKQKSSSPIPSVVTSNNEEPSLSFRDLLKGASSTSDKTVTKNGLLVLALDDTSSFNSTELKTVTKTESFFSLSETSLTENETTSNKTEGLLSLLKTLPSTTETTEETITEPLTLNSDITSKLSTKELKVLINEAKEYLKSKITEMPSYDKSNTEALPKTLKGLVSLAESLNIDVSKISFEEIKSTVSLDSKQISSKKITPTQETPVKQEVIKETKLSPESLVIKGNKVQSEQTVMKTQNDKSFKEQVTDQESKTVQNRESKSTPLFKAQNKTEMTTEQLVNAKVVNQQEQKAPTKKADETLKMLLQGESSHKKESGFTADFSVATARVIAPEATQKPQASTQSLESLLKGEENPTSNTKVDGLNINKSDTLEVKINEAKQMTKYLSADVKNAIDDYKSPFTRVKVDLNPQKLGSVELTVVQRGKNLHINLSSNNAAINALAMNANELKTQLTNNGINNATLNFNNNSQTAEQGFSGQQQQQQNSHQEREARREYNYLETEEKHEESMNSLEIIVPNYV